MGLGKTKHLIRDLLLFLKHPNNNIFSASKCQLDIGYDRTALYPWLKIFVETGYLIETKKKNSLYYKQNKG